MSVKIVKEETLPSRGVAAKGLYTTLNDFTEAWEKLASLPKGNALMVELSSVTVAKLKAEGSKMPSKSFAQTMNRRFTTGGLPFQAYVVSDAGGLASETTVAIRREVLEVTTQK